MPADRFLHKKAGHSRKVNLLTDLEYRVWTQYLLSADDFGVMRASAAAIKSDNDHLEHRPVKVIERCIDVLIKSTLVRAFEHQGRKYVFQPDWQDFQKVTWPAKTINPPPTSEAMATCTPATQLLFSVHPGARKVPSKFSDSTSEVLSDNSLSTSEKLSPRGKRLGLTANGERLTAQWGPRAIRELPDGPYDEWFPKFRDAYHPKARVDNPIVRNAFLAVFTREDKPIADIFAGLLEAVENHCAGEQWKRGMVPAMLKWLDEGLYLQRHDPPSEPQQHASKRPSWAPKAASA